VAVSTSAGPDFDVTAPSWPAPSSPCSPRTDATTPDTDHPLAGTRLLAAGSGPPTTTPDADAGGGGRSDRRDGLGGGRPPGHLGTPPAPRRAAPRRRWTTGRQHPVAMAAPSLPDVIVMELRLSDGSGIEATRDIRAARPQLVI
jgi:CheY-like chemotaxis protein